MRKGIGNIDDKFKNYTRSNAFHVLESKVDKLPTYEQIETLKEDVLEPMMQMHNRITDFSIDNLQLK
jgi:plasmid replication initiation protein